VASSAPVLERVSKSAANLIVQGRLRGAASSRFTVEIFGNQRPAGAEGEMFLGDGTAISNADGQASFTFTMDTSALTVMPTSFTATATSSDGATSELSQGIELSN
jgi:hypothetical protein